MSDPFRTDQPVLVIDDITVKPGLQQSVLAVLQGPYAELARARQLLLKQTLVLPPFERAGTASQIVLIWEYPSLNALWQARMIETEPAVAELWRQVDAMSLGRTRRIGRAEPMSGCERDMQEPPPVKEMEGALRRILFVQPQAELDASMQAQWVAAAQTFPDALRSQAGFHESYSFLPGQMTWDITTRDAISSEQLLAALPGPAQLTDAVELGVTLGSGVRDAILQGTKRTILIGANADLNTEKLAALEHVLNETAQYITAIRNWRVTRVARSHGSTPWTHCIEQEVFDTGVFLGDYLNHPYHWTVIDRFFHSEAPELSAGAFLHTLYPIQYSSLAAPR